MEMNDKLHTFILITKANSPLYPVDSTWEHKKMTTCLTLCTFWIAMK